MSSIAFRGCPRYCLRHLASVRIFARSFYCLLSPTTSHQGETITHSHCHLVIICFPRAGSACHTFGGTTNTLSAHVRVNIWHGRR
jgi:hypothetical protein